MIVVSYGGGTNSTAMLVGLHERGERPDLILFADTGGEKPHTYEHIAVMQTWLFNLGWPQIKTVRASLPSDRESLEAYCLDHGVLPAIAYGFKSCSIQYKRRPVDRYLKENECGQVTRLIGFDADEPHRAKAVDGSRYPLIEWEWGRAECVAAIERAGLPQPGKSSCFFCPSTRKADILVLAKQYPDLAMRAVAMEDNMERRNPGPVKGLGRSFAWRDLIKWDDDQIKLFGEQTMEISCDCYDGE